MDFIVDVNLPKNFSFFNSPNFVHAVDIDGRMTDGDIWDLAVRENRTILTKDVDFYHRSVLSTSRPKVVHFQLGNMMLRELHMYFDKNWLIILNAIHLSDLVVAYPHEVRSII
jgi:predicted nuclease of predicted toxin-antitoxin system